MMMIRVFSVGLLVSLFVMACGFQDVEVDTVAESDLQSRHGFLEPQDYNSSRSNKANGVASPVEDEDGKVDGLATAAKAQDYNSSRSNKAGGKFEPAEDEDGNVDGPETAAKAQDYNSSRSNKARGEANPGDVVIDDDVDEDDAVDRAQDYNTVRTNKTR